MDWVWNNKWTVTEWDCHKRKWVDIDLEPLNFMIHGEPPAVGDYLEVHNSKDTRISHVYKVIRRVRWVQNRNDVWYSGYTIGVENVHVESQPVYLDRSEWPDSNDLTDEQISKLSKRQGWDNTTTVLPPEKKRITLKEIEDE